MGGDHHEGPESGPAPQQVLSEPDVVSSSVGFGQSPARNGPQLTASSVLALQRTAGNAAVASSLGGPADQAQPNVSPSAFDAGDAAIGAALRSSVDARRRALARAPATPVAEPQAADAAGLIKRFEGWAGLDEEALAAELLGRLPADAALVNSVFDALGSTDRDDVAASMATAATEERLLEIARVTAGRTLLLRVVRELQAGWTFDAEAAEMKRLMNALNLTTALTTGPAGTATLRVEVLTFESGSAALDWVGENVARGKGAKGHTAIVIGDVVYSFELGWQVGRSREEYLAANRWRDVTSQTLMLPMEDARKLADALAGAANQGTYTPVNICSDEAARKLDGVLLDLGTYHTPQSLKEAIRSTGKATEVLIPADPKAGKTSTDTDRAPGTELAVDDAAEQDDLRFGVGMPRALPSGQAGNARVTPEIAVAMLENMVQGRPPFRPELGVGGASWFVTEGTPYTGVGATHSVPLQVDLLAASDGAVYMQADLMRIFAEEQAKARPEVEAQVRAKFKERTGGDAPEPLSNTLTDRINRQLRRLSERRMWERVGREVAASEAKTGEVVLPAGGEFSAEPGRFKIVADASKIRLREGPLPLIDAIRASGAATPVPALEANVVALARTLRLAGRVRNVFRVGGRILIVAAVANDLYHVVIAEDKTEAVLRSASGWAGAEAAALAFSALWAPADVAGPWAWAVHGVGMLVSGAAGYWVGSGAMRHVYRLIIKSQGDIRVQ